MQVSQDEDGDASRQRQWVARTVKRRPACRKAITVQRRPAFRKVRTVKRRPAYNCLPVMHWRRWSKTRVLLQEFLESRGHDVHTIALQAPLCASILGSCVVTRHPRPTYGLIRL